MQFARRARQIVVHAAFLCALAAAAPSAAPATSLDPFAFFRPSIAVSSDDRRELDRDKPIARVVRGTDREVGVFAAVQVHIDGDRLVAWTRDIEELKKSPYVLAIGRFSDIPRMEDLDRLTLDDEDLSAIRRCRRSNCGLKLAGSEMDRLRRALAGAGDDWRPALQDEFRQILLERVQSYLADGHAAVQGYEDKDGPLSLESRFSLLVNRSSFLTGSAPRFADTSIGIHARRSRTWNRSSTGRRNASTAARRSSARPTSASCVGPTAAFPTRWSREKGSLRPHYVNASLGLTAIMRGRPGSPNYLAYFNRSEVDVVGGVFGGLVRAFMERRLKNEASTVLLGVRQRLESGEPESVRTRP